MGHLKTESAVKGKKYQNNQQNQNDQNKPIQPEEHHQLIDCVNHLLRVLID